MLCTLVKFYNKIPSPEGFLEIIEPYRDVEFYGVPRSIF